MKIFNSKIRKTVSGRIKRLTQACSTVSIIFAAILSMAAFNVAIAQDQNADDADANEQLLSVTSDGDLSVNGQITAGKRIYGGTFFRAQKDGGTYKAKPLDCVAVCADQGGRMATLDEMYAYASSGHGICAKMWVLDEPNTVAAGYPMYENINDAGECGTTGTGNVPRIESLNRNQDWCNTDQKWDCGCSSIGQPNQPTKAASCP